MARAKNTESLNRAVWERAELERSAREAASIDERALRITASNIARYMDPPAHTPFPLEYAYYLLGDVRGKVVLDLGCGTGTDTTRLALRGAQVKAVDISPELLRLAERRLAANFVTPGVELVVGSAHDLPFANESVDIVFGIAILHHLDLVAAAHGVRRVLRPGGRGIFQEPVRNSPLLRRVRALIPYRNADVSPFEGPLTDEEIEAFARHFRRGRTRVFALPYISVANALQLTGRPLYSLYRVDGKLLRALPTLSRFATVKVFEVEKY
jgi:SAM-dependent methyltransferase